MTKKRRPYRRDRYDGLVWTEFRLGGDGTGEMRFCVERLFGHTGLKGYGHDARSSAMSLVEQLRFFADWIALRHGLEVRGDVAKLRERIKLMNVELDPREQEPPT
jgi:hypothetical protein